MADTMRVVSRVIAPCREQRSSRARMDSETVAVAPKSRNTTLGGSPAVRGRLDEQVPGVRIGVIEAVDEDLLAVGLDADARRLARIDAGRDEALEIGDLDALIHSVVSTRAVEYSGRTRVEAHRRRRLVPRDPVARARKVSRDALESRTPLPVVELGQHHLPDLGVESVSKP